MSKKGELPPLPASDKESLAKDYKAREFWKGNQIVREIEQPFKKCNHEFKVVSNGVQCVRCHFGLMGSLEVKNGKLYHKGDKLPL